MDCLTFAHAHAHPPPIKAETIFWGGVKASTREQKFGMCVCCTCFYAVIQGMES